MLKIVADENIPGLQQAFSSVAELTVVSGRNITPDLLVDADALLVRSITPVNKALLSGNSSIQFVGSATSGIDHIDLDYLQNNSIEFAYAPGANAMSVVNYIFSALSVLCVEEQFDWFKSSVGIIGGGHIGSALALCLEKLDIKVTIYDPYLDLENSFLSRFLVDFETACQSDVISIHTPLTLSASGITFPTENMFNDKVLNSLNEGQVLINTARGGIIDEQYVLKNNLTEKITLILDAWKNEPDINLSLLKNVRIGTTHIAGYSFEGKMNGTALLKEALFKYFNLAKQPESLSDEMLGIYLKEDYENDCHAVSQAILTAYDVREDFAKLQKGMEQESPAVYFDHLRKTYPKRYEFSQYKIPRGECLNIAGLERIFNYTKALGFNVIEDNITEE